MFTVYIPIYHGIVLMPVGISNHTKGSLGSQRMLKLVQNASDPNQGRTL